METGKWYNSDEARLPKTEQIYVLMMIKLN